MWRWRQEEEACVRSTSHGNSDTAGCAEATSSRLGMASATLRQSSRESLPQRLRRSGFSCGGRTGCSGDLPFLCKPQSHVSPIVNVSALHLLALAGSHSQVVTEMTPLLVPVLCLVLSCDQMLAKNNRKEDWLGCRLESSVHHGREGEAEQEDLYRCSRETERESLQNRHTETLLP